MLIGDKSILFVECFSRLLGDPVMLVQRGALDLLNTTFPIPLWY